MSSRATRIASGTSLAFVMALGMPVMAAAQDNAAQAQQQDSEDDADEGPDDLPVATTAAEALAEARILYGPPPPVEDCPDDDATAISGEIVVCRKRRDNSEFLTQSREESQNDYARRTQDAGDPRAPDVAGAGIFKGPATVGGLCVIPPCPPPPALIIDVEALPEAPPGSDADRIARGLAPLGDDAPRQPQEGRPPDEEPITESASPAEPQ